MYPRTEYEMTEVDLKELLAEMKPTPLMLIGGSTGPSQQENANRAWAALGKRMGFDGATVRPVQGKGNRSFTAIPSETETARAERLAAEAKQKRTDERARLTAEIAERQAKLDALQDA